MKRRHLRWFSVGAVAALLAWVVATTALFGVYVLGVGQYERTYGVLGGAIAFLLWLWLSNLALLFGAVLDTEVERARQLHAGIDRRGASAAPAARRPAHRARTASSGRRRPRVGGDATADAPSTGSCPPPTIDESRRPSRRRRSRRRPVRRYGRRIAPRRDARAEHPCQAAGTMDDTQHSTEPPLAPAPPTAAGRTTLGGALADDRRLRAWMWVATSFLAVLLFTVSVPLAATLYGVHLLAAFATSLAMAGALPLAVRLPWVAVGLATVGTARVRAALGAAPRARRGRGPSRRSSGRAPWSSCSGCMRVSGSAVRRLARRRSWSPLPFAFVDAGAAANVDHRRGGHRARPADRAAHHPASADRRRAVPRARALRLRAAAARARRGTQPHRPRAARRRGARPVDHPRAGDERAVPGRAG